MLRRELIMIGRGFQINQRTPRKAVLLCKTSSFFGLSEVLGVITNPAETIKQLNESKDLLRKAKEQMYVCFRKHQKAALIVQGFESGGTENSY